MKVYLAGAMRGIPFYNFPAFDAAEKKLVAEGHTVRSPAQMDRAVGFDAMKCKPDTDWSAIPDGFDFDACVTRDIDAVRWCDAVYVLAGSEQSSGAQAEVAMARWLQKRVIYEAPAAECGEVRVVDPNTGGAKGSKLARFDLLPWDALWSVAELYGRGAAKYADRNWEKGYAWHLSHAALHRHLAQFWQGERIDAETGAHHLTAVVFHALALLAFDLRKAGTDDRPILTKEAV